MDFCYTYLMGRVQEPESIRFRYPCLTPRHFSLSYAYRVILESVLPA